MATIGPLSSVSSSPFAGLIPAFALLAYVGFAYLIFVLSGARRRYLDPEAAGRTTGLSTRGMRLFFSWLMRPWIDALLRSGLPPNAITTLSLGISLLSGVALAAGYFSLGGWLFCLAGVCDFFDGRMARAMRIDSPRGAALDSIVDRYAESAVLGGLAWYYRSTWVLFPVLLALTGSLLVPYVRAKAEGLQVKLQEVGWLQRPERVVLIALTTTLAPLLEFAWPTSAEHPLYGLTVLGISILAVGTQITAAQRTTALLALLSPTGREKAGPPRSLRAVIASLVATGSDALLVIVLSRTLLQLPLPVATALGCLLGAFVNFTMNRRWAFEVRSGSWLKQAKRYALTSLSSAVFNAGGVAVVALLPEVNDVWAWLLVRGTVFGVWTFPLFQTYVFTQGSSARESEEPSSDPAADLLDTDGVAHSSS